MKAIINFRDFQHLKTKDNSIIQQDKIFRSDIHGYGELYQRYSDQKPIFSDKFMEILQTKQDVDTEISNKTEAE